MENWLGLCLVLLSVTCFCKAVNTCNVPDTKKSYVTSLAINMARSVGPCVPPDPSVLLALNLGQVKDPTAQDMLIEQLKNDAVDRVSKNVPFTSGKVALYVLALRSSCVDPSNISVQKGSINLVQLLENKTREELHAFENGPSPKASVITTWYQVGLDLIGLCTMSSPYAISAACIVANHTTPEVCGSVDTAAVVVMGLVCVLGMENVPEQTLTEVRTTLAGLLGYILEHREDGLIGNAYSTGLAAQALLAAEKYFLVNWNCSRTIQKVLDLIPKKTFSLPIAAAQVLPFLWGTSYVSVKSLQCPEDDAHLISVEYTIVNNLIGEHFCHPTIVAVKEGSTLLQVMQKAAEQDPNEFSFESQDSSWGVFITAINHLAGSTNDKTYWQFFSDNTPLEVGVSSYIPKKNDHITVIFSKY
ncbi:cobalamin binding intrinsic factor-like [Rana temporaria]|uniref:cobalamin binding intrinsic factor-like n=1 Tax=Rana temporaria TaxID=8407 RepID=UPI001AADA932|nr:cobalamin binding intrinsic factor-like [Rana temporaria]